MIKNPVVITGAAIVLVVVLVAGWFLASPLFINRTVDEAFPIEVPEQAALAQMSEEERLAMEREVVTAMNEMPATEMSEPMPTDMPMAETETSEPVALEPVVVSQGQLQDADNFHQGRGTATIFQLPDGSHILRFEDFEVTNGPDLRVLLASGSQPTNHDELGEYIDLGVLKGNVGNQNYVIPADADVSQFQSVVIYCRAFSVVFSTAELGNML